MSSEHDNTFRTNYVRQFDNFWNTMSTHQPAAHEIALDALLYCALSDSNVARPTADSRAISPPLQSSNDDKAVLGNDRGVQTLGGAKVTPYSTAFYEMAGLESLFRGGPPETPTEKADTVDSQQESRTLSGPSIDPRSPLLWHLPSVFDKFYDDRGTFPCDSGSIPIHQDSNDRPSDHDWDKENRVPSSPFSGAQDEPSAVIPYTLKLQFGTSTVRPNSSLIHRGTLGLNPHDLREEITLPLSDSGTVTFRWSLHLSRWGNQDPSRATRQHRKSSKRGKGMRRVRRRQQGKKGYKIPS
ncbi:hypothetical protein GQ53DRAFT_186666 [Thozetella sp. PMI_491]|nr:hypothetical protein GQ53DRAFT_186666 [Thozetella sp. PMI_491]